jgi:hypothetical protein
LSENCDLSQCFGSTSDPSKWLTWLNILNWQLQLVEPKLFRAKTVHASGFPSLQHVTSIDIVFG